nr:ribosome recycling factor [Acidobacteriota bacterium]MBW4044956.1 ribosome recycling factor [Acidobacteriota bacterium]
MAAPVMAGIPALKETHQQLKARMDKAVTDFKANLGSIRTGRASAQMLDQIRIDYYGTDTPLTQVAQITSPDANMLVVQPWDASLLNTIEKALRTSDLGFNPQNDGKLIRVPIPPMTEERRRDIVKHLNKVLEEHRTGIRNIRRDGN